MFSGGGRVGGGGVGSWPPKILVSQNKFRCFFWVSSEYGTFGLLMFTQCSTLCILYTMIILLFYYYLEG